MHENQSINRNLYGYCKTNIIQGSKSATTSSAQQTIHSQGTPCANVAVQTLRAQQGIEVSTCVLMAMCFCDVLGMLDGTHLPHIVLTARGRSCKENVGEPFATCSRFSAWLEAQAP